jgi:DNA-directed RNA polymerase beta' subunit
MSTLRWFYEAAVERILRKRLQERYDKGFLAGIDTAFEAVKLHTPRSGAARLAIEQAREGYLQEIESRG